MSHDFISLLYFFLSRHNNKVLYLYFIKLVVFVSFLCNAATKNECCYNVTRQTSLFVHSAFLPVVKDDLFSQEDILLQVGTNTYYRKKTISLWASSTINLLWKIYACVFKKWNNFLHFFLVGYNFSFRQSFSIFTSKSKTKKTCEAKLDLVFLPVSFLISSERSENLYFLFLCSGNDDVFCITNHEYLL